MQVFQPDKRQEPLPILGVDLAVLDKTLQIGGEDALPHAVLPRPYRPEPILEQISPEDLPVGVACGVLVRADGNHKGGNPILPHRPGGGDIHHAAEGVVIADSPALRLVPDSQQRAVIAGAAHGLPADHAQAHPGHGLPHPLVAVQNLLAVRLYHVDAGMLHSVQDLLIVPALHNGSSCSQESIFLETVSYHGQPEKVNFQHPKSRWNFQKISEAAENWGG